ncbi:MAG: hypothetical protein KGJ06_01745, partial [Pseudomonadota bacterium]|nr:hypothetical protein [Pseudomonadota bacterium]
PHAPQIDDTQQFLRNELSYSELYARLRGKEHNPVTDREEIHDTRTYTIASDTAFKEKMYALLISEIGAQNITDAVRNQGEYGGLLLLVGQNSRRQDKWRQTHAPGADGINDVKWFDIKNVLSYGELYAAAEKLIKKTARLSQEPYSGYYYG